ncbi:MAG: ABC transporter substrate-binding protein [Proteobacteria bacterium]|jgi:oligopeptide transport system substrate-binding protein|nr:ABC transporter substrate-binding protein [Pseudomonadota bacterium]
MFLKIIILLTSLIARAETLPPVFRLTLLSEPKSISLKDQRGSGSNYFLSQIYGTLLEYHNGELKDGFAEKCTYKKEKLISCQLKPGLKWSDGTPLRAQDFVNSYRSYLDPQRPGLRPDLFFNLLNAEKVLRGELPPSRLGVRAKDDTTLEFQLVEADREFIFNLAHLFFAPEKDGISSGPYKILNWKKGDRIVLTSNVHFWEKNPGRPQVEFLTVSEDTTALNMYEKNEIQFLRRLPTLFIPKFRKRSDYLEVPMIRFDYIGFSGELLEKPELRRLLSTSLDYEAFQKLFYARPRPGCPGLPSRFFTQIPCLDHIPPKPPEKSVKIPLKFVYSKQGGEDHQRGADWLISQWKKAGFDVIAQQEENKIFLDRLEKLPPSLFRKGNSPERPTCRAALESFLKSSPENYIRFENVKFEASLKEMRITSRLERQRELCTSAMKILLEDYRLIPTGPIFFTVLLKQGWTGLRLNELNTLNLSKLKRD